jgi:hypothetical protein
VLADAPRFGATGAVTAAIAGARAGSGLGDAALSGVVTASSFNAIAIATKASAAAAVTMGLRQAFQRIPGRSAGGVASSSVAVAVTVAVAVAVAVAGAGAGAASAGRFSTACAHSRGGTPLGAPAGALADGCPQYGQ